MNETGIREDEKSDENEERPVLDVHLPHPTHTWRDFWIHLATISIGLLIAISLEQSVEWVHHLHQRHQLEADLREEGVKNVELSELDLQFMDGGMAANAARMREVESALAARRKKAQPFPESTFVLPPQGALHQLFILPSSAVWTTAKEGGLLDLIPRELARRYQRLYLQIDYLTGVEVLRREYGRGAEAYRCRFSDGSMPCVANLSQMTDEQLGEYAGLLAGNFTHFREEKQRVLTFKALNKVILDGGSMDDLGRAAIATEQDSHPDTFLRDSPSPGVERR